MRILGSGSYYLWENYRRTKPFGRGLMTSTFAGLEAAAVFERARLATGLSDYGDDTLRDRVTILIGEIRQRALGEEAEQNAANVLHWLLTSRLKFFEDRNRYPIAEEKIERPIFANGEPRSGT